MAHSLGLFAATPAALALSGQSAFIELSAAQTAPRRAAASRAQPLPLCRGESGAAVLFHGAIDNRAELARMLDCRDSVPGRLYLRAFERWGDDCDRYLVGDYCALIETADGAATRIARSPWRGPPLIFSQDATRTMVASVPRALIAAGLPARLDREALLDQLLLNGSGEHGWYEGSLRIDIGQQAWLHRDGSYRIASYYDHCAPRRTRLKHRADYVEAADTLLREGVAKALDGARRPGSLLSGGLDSANVAVRAAALLEPGAKLDCFTFRPHRDCPEPGDGSYFIDDWPLVERLAAMHPRIAAHGVRCDDYDQDWERLYQAIGVAPYALQNMAIYQPALAAARDAGCDVLFDAEMGNKSFSCDGRWGYSEYLLRGRWGQLGKAVASLRPRPRPLLLGCLWHGLGPLFPDSAWLAWQRFKGRDGRSRTVRLANPAPDAPGLDAALARSRAAGIGAGRSNFASRGQWLRNCFARGSGEMGEISQGFEQVYGLTIRDPSAYRPLMEFCLGLPTDLFLHDGTDRWLGRELGRGLLPEAQRGNRRYGFHNGDWHQRLTPRLPELARAVAAAREDPVLAGLIDLDAVEQLLADWPAEGSLDQDEVAKFALAVPRAAMLARFSAFVSGRNR